MGLAHLTLKAPHLFKTAACLSRHREKRSLRPRTLRVWRDGKAAATLSGHEGPVLCLLVLPGGEMLSGSGDTSVKMWAPGGGPCIHTIKAHTDTVRGMCLVPGLGFATASHDMTLKVTAGWAMGGVGNMGGCASAKTRLETRPRSRH
ncbi:Ubiquitin homeostasis protein lub1 [Tetrabaena socialis]|uniref:Ubiquitin homeostasis protein lub1 n=1 Tax=Tetrabaena socialis TaxID=47790 RepID=A0A2J7ZPA7_9CHLO|nr:Ubiquitin homeostasis protein lub1 [Tetrabaena socialis]|eukprot:PNH02104.1 Ubiquitin homeostasis protein lub1 [Tetrabaena socialis]